MNGARSIGISLDDSQLRRFSLYYRLLEDWGGRMNLTSVRGESAVVEHLFMRSLRVAAPAGGWVSTSEWFAGRRLMDVGSGAGFPGLPLKIAMPDLDVVLLDARKKRCAFLREVIRELDLSGVEVVEDRAERAGHEPLLRESFDVVTARAVGRLASLAELTLPFASLGGVAVLPKGADADAVKAEVEEAESCALLMGAAGAIVNRVIHPGKAPADSIVYWMKVEHTPAKYPRRVGVPTKYPILGGSSASGAGSLKKT